MPGRDARRRWRMRGGGGDCREECLEKVLREFDFRRSCEACSRRWGYCSPSSLRASAGPNSSRRPPVGHRYASGSDRSAPFLLWSTLPTLWRDGRWFRRRRGEGWDRARSDNPGRSLRLARRRLQRPPRRAARPRPVRMVDGRASESAARRGCRPRRWRCGGLASVRRSAPRARSPHRPGCSHSPTARLWNRRDPTPTCASRVCPLGRRLVVRVCKDRRGPLSRRSRNGGPKGRRSRTPSRCSDRSPPRVSGALPELRRCWSSKARSRCPTMGRTDHGSVQCALGPCTGQREMPHFLREFSPGWLTPAPHQKYRAAQRRGANPGVPTLLQTRFPRMHSSAGASGVIASGVESTS